MNRKANGMRNINQKEKVIQAIKQCDFKQLEQLLSNKITYDEVRKEVFINELKCKIQQAGITAFDAVLNGVCGVCKKGCSVVRFFHHNEQATALDLLILGGDEVKDIFECCNSSFLDDEEEDVSIISLDFYLEQTEESQQSDHLLMDIAHMEEAFSKIKTFIGDKVITIQDYYNWYKEYEGLICIYDDPFSEKKRSKNFDKLSVYIKDDIIKVKEKTQNYRLSNHNFNKIQTYDELVQWFEAKETTFLSFTILEEFENPFVFSFKIDGVTKFKVDFSGHDDYFLFIQNYQEAEKIINFKFSDFVK